jgi:Kef-type K+ transport system membrane component KefB
MPQVVGALVAGVLLGPTGLGLVTENEFLTNTSELGVIILMFMAGLDTDLEELKSTGFASFVIAMVGVLVPLGSGMACYLAFYNNPGDAQNILKAAFIGVILTATSVSITVETLREMGRLKSKVGTAILGAAVIDDILGIVALTVLTSFTDSEVKPLFVFGRIVLYFVFILVVALCAQLVIAHSDTIHVRRRMAIYALAFCLLLSFASEEFFGIADITGAYFAGLILCNVSVAREYVSRKMTVLGYMIFSPIFFASIGIQTELRGMTGTILLFALVLTVVAILSKIIGCGLGARVMGFETYDAITVGMGMVSRGEVALIVAQKGQQAGLVDPHMFPPVVLMVIATTLITPILLQKSMQRETDANTEHGAHAPEKSPRLGPVVTAQRPSKKA